MKAFPSRLALLGATLSGLLLAGCQQAYFRVLNFGLPAQPSQTVRFDQVHQLSLDVYRPPAGRPPAAVVVFFYGGSWRDGARGDYRFVGEALSRQGLLVLIPDYRKAPAAAFPAFMDDAAMATAWASSHAAGLGGDPRRIFLMGHSAGAHIAALLGTDGEYLARQGLAPRDLAGVIGLAGPYDFLPLTEPAIQQVFGRPEDWPRSQPVNFVGGDEPPFLLLHGDSDTRVRPANSERLAARLRAAGDRVSLRILPGIGHIGLVNGFYSTRFSPALRLSLDWIHAQAGEPVTPLAPAPIALPAPG